MANYGFEVGLLKSSFNDAMLRSGVVTTEGVTSIPNGALVFADFATAIPNNVYGSKEENLENFKRFTTGDDEPAYILDASAIPNLKDEANNVYNVGNIMTGMTFAPDKVLRYRELALNDRFYVYDGNITGTPSDTNKYLVPTNGSFNFTATDTDPESGLVVQIIKEKPLNRGVKNVGKKYLCRVVRI